MHSLVGSAKFLTATSFCVACTVLPSGPVRKRWPTCKCTRGSARRYLVVATSWRHRPVVAASAHMHLCFASASSGRGGIFYQFTPPLPIGITRSSSPSHGRGGGFHQFPSPRRGGIAQSWRCHQNYAFIALSRRHLPVVAASTYFHRLVTAASPSRGGTNKTVRLRRDFRGGIALSWRLPPKPIVKSRRPRPIVAASAQLHIRRHFSSASPCRGGFPLFPSPFRGGITQSMRCQ